MTGYRRPEEVRGALERALQSEVHALEVRLVSLVGRNHADVKALVERRFPWRRVAPYVAGFVLALALMLPTTFEATRTSLIRAELQRAQPDAAFAVFGSMDAVSRSVVRAFHQLEPDAPWKLSLSLSLSNDEPAIGFAEAARSYRWLYAVRGAGQARETTHMLLLVDEVGSAAIRVELRWCPSPPSEVERRFPRRWRTCLPGIEGTS